MILSHADQKKKKKQTAHSLPSCCQEKKDAYLAKKKFLHFFRNDHFFHRFQQEKAIQADTACPPIPLEHPENPIDQGYFGCTGDFPKNPRFVASAGLSARPVNPVFSCSRSYKVTQDVTAASVRLFLTVATVCRRRAAAAENTGCWAPWEALIN